MPKQFDLFTNAPVPVVQTGRRTTKQTPKEEIMTKTKTTPPKSSRNPAPAAKPATPVQPSQAAEKPATIPPKSWEAFKLDADSKLTAAAPSATFRPKSTMGMVRIHALGLYIKPSEIAAYHAARRDVAIMRADYLKRHYQIAFESEIRAAGGDEAAALSALGINYHDDRGDGFLHVVRMQPKHLTAWAAAASAAGVKSSRVRAA